MEILKVCNILLSKYQMHLFSVMLYYAYMQFKILKKLEVQTQECKGKFDLQEYKYSELEKAITLIREAKSAREKKDLEIK